MSTQQIHELDRKPPIELLFAYHTGVGLAYVKDYQKHFISLLPILSVSLSKKIHKKLIRTFQKLVH